MLIFLGLTLIFCLILAIVIRKNSHLEQNNSEAFWAREAEANSTRKKDISKIKYITVPLSSLPLGVCPAFEDLTETENVIRELSEQKIFSLNGMSNTDVKLNYGVANFDYLCQCDERFSSLIQALSKEAQLLSSMGLDEEAKTVLEYSVSIGGDLPKDYQLLAELYKGQNDHLSIQKLIDKASCFDSLTKDSLIERLNNINASF